MPVPITPPITVPAVPEKTFSLWFFSNVKFENLHDPDAASITFDKVPFDGDATYLWSHKETITKPFWEVVQNVSHVVGGQTVTAASITDAVVAILPAIESYNPQ